MKRSELLVLFILILFFTSCETDNDLKNSFTMDKVNGYVQKGPYLNGTAITISELAEDLVPTGNNYPSQILDNKGTFEVKNVKLSSPYVEVKADGYYFNEVSNTNSTAPLTLFALSDLKNRSNLNVNVLSTLEKGRVSFLVSIGSSFKEAKKQAQSEILSIFEIERSEMEASDLLDITKQGEDHAILLAISVILQGKLTVPEFSELLANISTDIREDGILNSKTLGSMLINNAKALQPDQVRKNLEARYEILGLAVTIPDFEKYIQQFIANTEFEFTSLPTITTSIATDITAVSANCGGNLLKEGTSPVTVRGICWSTSQNPDTTANKTIVGKGSGIFTAKLISLAPNTKYYARAYAVNAAGIAYGNEISFSTLELTAGTVIDIDGNIYHSVIIGTQVWMVENLKTTKYNDGTPIPYNSDYSWDELMTAAYGWYDNDISHKADYGALYNWYAVNSGKLCPPGWHVPSDEEWNILAEYLGGYKIAGGKMKEAGTSHWGLLSSPAPTNESGFTGLPGGIHSSGFIGIGYYGIWWSTTTGEYGSNCYYLSHDHLDLGFSTSENGRGMSVRCIKD